ncbi:very-long-chain (3R)-3-hydroxyacyl-CoA dehydratase isoform X2 [Nematostella vectensis]|uniref:very-long-chain (3R)-3-hydroxyacyl-CoA dehydratase isoform X2 n=1 Tax=Nematostella vectensis TaxID=45351 RepID=UPI002076FF87|nr:very-long-chain (3R)-3-hydroxyacyl-CoA dehydratase isoform X2 [Nematostella vectensis]
MAAKLKPIVRWAQTKERLYLTLELSDVQYPSIDLTESRLLFKGYGHGAKGEDNYELEVNFLEPINPGESSHKVMERYVEFSIAKQKGREFFWQRLVDSEKRPNWLKINFDRWKNEDDTEDEKQEAEEEQKRQISNIIVEQRLKRDYDMHGDRVKQDVVRFLKKFYLVTYNGIQFILFLYIVAKIISRFIMEGKDSLAGNYDAVSDIIASCQLAAFLEVLNPAIGIVKTGVFAPFAQVFGRNLVLFMVVVPHPTLHADPVVSALFFTWSVIEIIRYPFYIVQIIGIPFEPLIWLRYTAWIPLYPVGMITEVILIWKALPLLDQTQRFSIILPNAFNFSFSFAMFLRFYLIFMIYGGSYMILAPPPESVVMI